MVALEIQSLDKMVFNGIDFLITIFSEIFEYMHSWFLVFPVFAIQQKV